MLKIIHIIPSLLMGGAERLTIDICNELSKRKDVRLALITFNNKLAYNHLSPTVNRIIIPSSVSLSIFKKNKINVNNLQKFINEFMPDVIHTHLFESELVTRFCNYKEAKWVSHMHSNYEQLEKFSFSTLFEKKKITNFFEKAVLIKRYKKNGGNIFLSISDDNHRYNNKTLRKSFKKILLYNGTKLKSFTNNLNRSIEEIRILNVGRIVKYKNQIFLLEIIHKLIIKGYKVSLTIAGSGPEQKNIESTAKALGVHHCLRFLGTVDNIELYYNQSNLYLHTAINEAFGLALVEAMASGLPLISTSSLGKHDLINNGVNGFKLINSSTEQIIKKIEFIFKDKKNYNKFSKNSIRMSKKYNIEQYIKSLIEIYKN